MLGHQAATAAPTAAHALIAALRDHPATPAAPAAAEAGVTDGVPTQKRQVEPHYHEFHAALVVVPRRVGVGARALRS